MTDVSFTLADRVAQDAATALYYAGQASAWRRAAVSAGSDRRRCLGYARADEAQVVACAVRIEVRLQLLADQRASA